MALTPLETTTGEAILPDVGTLYYNGVFFSSLFHTEINGEATKDNANRTVKQMDYTLTVEGVVTLALRQTTTDANMLALRQALDMQGGNLQYQGKGFGPCNINPPGGGGTRDVAWGPKPRTLFFQPLGGSRAALVRWTVQFSIFEGDGNLTPPSSAGGALPVPVLQFNQEITIGYDDECYSNVSIKGSLEVPITRPAVGVRTLTYTVDDYRQAYLDAVADTIDLTRFRVTRRNFNVSRDRRVMDWEILAEELPPMGLPRMATNARGTMSVRSVKGLGLVQWLVSLRGTYVIRKDASRRWAFEAFMSLAWFRMWQSAKGFLDTKKPEPPPPPPGLLAKGLALLTFDPGFIVAANVAASVIGPPKGKPAKKTDRRAIVMHFGFDEGLYLDSRQITFEITWKVFTSFTHIFLATGVWRTKGTVGLGGGTKFDTGIGGNFWRTSVRDISGWKGVLENRIDPAQDVIVDFGGP